MARDKEESLGPLLRRAGYRCAYGGKDHTPTDLSKYMMANSYELLTHDQRDGLAKACAEFLRQPHDRPFFLFASFINPHDICYMAIRAHAEAQKGKSKKPLKSGSPHFEALDAP